MKAANTAKTASPDVSIQFRHDFFASFEDVSFRMSDSGVPVAVLKLGSHDAILDIDAIIRQYGVQPDEPDGIMLANVAKGLKFVRELKPGGELPKEITCRQASWSPSERHFLIARHRLTMQLVTWVTGSEHIFTSVDELMQLVDDPQVKKHISLAFSEAAKELGLDNNRREEVTHYIEQLANELACIEAERDTFAEIKAMGEKVLDLRRIYSSDRGMQANSDQVARLMQRAEALFQEQFDQIDAQTGEILAMLKNIDNQVNYIRAIRDHLYCRLAAWEDILRTWRGVFSVKSEENTNKIRDLYRFLAPRYMQTSEWVLIGKLGTGNAKNIGGTMRW
jgi:hypothetical protein